MLQHDESNEKGGIYPLTLKRISLYRQIPLDIQHCVISESSDISHGRPHRWHSHEDFAEFVIVVKGEAESNSPDGEPLQMRTGDVVLFPPGTVHCYTASREMRHYNILFSPELATPVPGFLSQLPNWHYLWSPLGNSPCILHLEGRDFKTLLDMLERIMQERLKRTPGYEEAMLAEFHQVLIHVSRHATLQENQKIEKPFVTHIRRVIHFMEDNSDKALTLEQLSREAVMSESNFRHHFRILTGFSPIEYLIRLRLQKAALTLLNSDYRITYIAQKCGFTDSNYFARKFHAVFHTTPRNFRKMCRDGELNLNEEITKLKKRPLDEPL